LLAYRKNALTGVTRESFAFISRNSIAYSVFLVLAVCVYLLIEILIGEQLIPGDWGSIAGFNLTLDLLPLVLTALATAIFATPLHNFIINNDQSHFPRYFGRLLIFAFFEFIPILLLTLGLTVLYEAVAIRGYFIIAVAFILASMILGVILTTVLPYVAITPVRKLNLREPIELSNGYRWSIFVKLLRLTVALGLIWFGARKILSLLSPLLPSDDTITGYYGPLFFENLGYSASALIFVTMGSLIYVRLTNRKDEINTVEPQKPE
jgi:ABC-type multidrug transport system fused ATPase/permease subunit